MRSPCALVDTGELHPEFCSGEGSTNLAVGWSDQPQNVQQACKTFCRLREHCAYNLTSYAAERSAKYIHWSQHDDSPMRDCEKLKAFGIPPR